jgi:hypothetical protein
MTYLEAVNNVLLRLRERQVATVNETAYSELIGQFVNDAMTEVENAWDWSSLRTTYTITTAVGTVSYATLGAQTNFTTLNVINDTTNVFMQYKTGDQFDDWYLNSTPANGAPIYYNWNGTSAAGDMIMDLYPQPDDVYTIRINVMNRSQDMVNDTDVILPPAKCVTLLAYAKAVEERGEDGGMSAQSAYRAAERVIGDEIAQDGARYPERLIYAPV